MKNNKFIETLKAVPSFPGDKERQIEFAYNDMLKTWFPGIVISNPYKCDGYFETEINGKKTRIICEYKYDYDLSNKVVRSQILAQVLFYLKKFERDGKPFPNVIFIGDVNECFAIHANYLLKFLDFENVDWDAAASSAGHNAELVTALANDDERNAFVFDVTDGFDFKNVYKKICDYATNVVRQIRINEHNIDKVFDVFSNKIVKGKVSANDIVAIFFGCLTDSENYFLHPTKKNCMMANGQQIRVAGDAFKAFMTHFASDYSPREKARIAAISDRLIEDTNRRSKGEFYTPTVFVDYAHGMIAKQFGDNWKDEYVVWDCACGTKNLTRDYKFKELYCSTLEQGELDISKQYNPEATSFVFDFLNDQLDNLPVGLLDAFKQNKKIIVLFNPPYKTASSSVFNNVGQGTTETIVNHDMKNDDMKLCARESYAQFLYRLMQIKSKFNITDFNLTFFCKPKFIAGESFKDFRNKFLTEFKFENGIFFNAGHFTNVSTQWGITFNIWSSGETIDKENFIHTIVDVKDGEIVSTGTKVLYNNDLTKYNAFDWVLNGIKQKRTIECPNFRHTDLTIDQNGLVKETTDSIGCMYTSINNIGMASMTYYHTPEWSIERNNFDKWAALFTVVNVPTKSWITEKDTTFSPNESYKYYSVFISDSIINMIFSGYDVSMRNMQWKQKSINIKNHFFWMSKSEIEQLADENRLDELYQDAHTSDERFVYTKLQGLTLSPEAKAVLDKACELVKKSMKYRTLFDAEHPEYQLTKCWDAGWYQIKAMLKQYMPEELKEFKALQKNLADKMRPMVYELGFLKK